jgi:uncharacterized protein (TIGR03083 family)
MQASRNAAQSSIVREEGQPPVAGHAEWMRVAAEEYRRLLELLRTLQPDDWNRPTDCTKWDVRMLASHLVGAAEAAASRVQMLPQLRGGRRLGERGAQIDAMNAFQVHSRLGVPPAKLMMDFERASARAIRSRARMPGLIRGISVPFGEPLGTRPVGYLIDCIYTRDSWMHRVDLSRATDKTLLLTAEHDGRVVSDIVEEWAGTHGQPFVLTLGGPAGGRWRAGSGGDEIAMDAIEFARTLSGRESGDALLQWGVPF